MDNPEYIKLDNIIAEIYESGRELTSEEKEEFGEAITDNIYPYDVYTEMDDLDIYDTLYEMYSTIEDIEILRMWLDTNCVETMEEYISEYGFPIPSEDDMVESIIEDIDIEDYINDNYDEYIDLYYEQIIYNLTDNEIIKAFNTYVDIER